MRTEKIGNGLQSIETRLKSTVPRWMRKWFTFPSQDAENAQKANHGMCEVSQSEWWRCMERWRWFGYHNICPLATREILLEFTVLVEKNEIRRFPRRINHCGTTTTTKNNDRNYSESISFYFKIVLILFLSQLSSIHLIHISYQILHSILNRKSFLTENLPKCWNQLLEVVSIHLYTFLSVISFMFPKCYAWANKQTNQHYWHILIHLWNQ